MRNATIYRNAEEAIDDLGTDLVNRDETVVARMAATNATGFALDEFEINEKTVSADGATMTIACTMELVGEGLEDRPVCGERITVDARLCLRWNGGAWVRESYKVVSAQTRL